MCHRGAVSMATNSPIGIERNTVYPIAAFCAIVAWNKAAMRSARRAGLPVYYVGNRAFIRGADFIEWIGTRPTEAPSAARLIHD